MHPVRRLAVLACRASVLCAAFMLVGISQHVSSVIAAPADGVASFSVQPILPKGAAATKQTYFVLDAAHGATVQGAVRVTNTGTARGTVQLYAVDATTGQSGGLVYRASQAPRHDVGAWLVLSADAITLSPHASQIVTFTGAIPVDAYAGTHLGGIVAANLSQQTATGQSAVHITIQHLSVVAVQIDVAGTTVEHVEVTSIAQQAPDYGSVRLGILNSGTVLVKPTGQLQILDATNQVVRDISFKLGQMLPQANVGLTLALGGDPLAAGAYQAVIMLTYGQDLQQSISRLKLNVGQPPISLQLPQVKLPGGQVIQPTTWVMMGVLALAATLAIILIVRRARRRQPLRRNRSSVYSHHSHYAP